METKDDLRALMERRMGAPHTQLWFGPGHLYRIHELESAILTQLRKVHCESLADKKVLDVGCGFGYWLGKFITWGAQARNAFGVDLMDERIDTARRSLPAGVRLECRSAEHLAFADSSFDIVTLFLLLSQVSNPATRSRVCSEAIRVTRPGGLILWYDYRSPLDREIIPMPRRVVRELFPKCDLDFESITPAGPLIRRIAPYSTIACDLLRAIPALRTHNFGVIRPRKPTASSA